MSNIIRVLDDIKKLAIGNDWMIPIEIDGVDHSIFIYIEKDTIILDADGFKLFVSEDNLISHKVLKEYLLEMIEGSIIGADKVTIQIINII